MSANENSASTSEKQPTIDQGASSGSPTKRTRSSAAVGEQPASTAGETVLVRFVRQIGLGAAGFWLTFLIAGAVFGAAIIFSATQFQARLATLTLYGGSLSAWKADQIRSEWAASLDVVNAAKQAVNEKQKVLAKSYSVRSALSEQNNLAAAENSQIRARLIPKIARLDAEATKGIVDIGGSDAIAILSPKIDDLKSKDKSIEQDFEAWKAADAKWISIIIQMNAREEEAKNLTTEIDKSSKELEEAKKKAQLVFPPRNEKSVPEDQLIQIENTIYEFQTMYENYYPVYYFVLAPSDVLVLVLVIGMGILGSSMQLSHIYLTEYGRKSISFYVFRPFLGLITAFVVFIVMKTGIPLFTDVTRIGGSSTVNPYFISFLAIISGLLSERALEWVRQLGATYFRDADSSEPPRWARENLKSKFDAINRDPKSVRSALKANESEFEDWLEGKEPVPAPAQVLIAVVLGIARRDLFTDLPPVDKENPSGG